MANRNATPPATYFISVLELATGEKLGKQRAPSRHRNA